MKSKDVQQRILAVQRFLNGEKPESICVSLGRSKAWLYKWLKRQEHRETDESWSMDSSRRPKNSANRTPDGIEEIVQLVRLSLCNKGVFCGAQAILWELEDLGVSPPPSLRTIDRSPQCFSGFQACRPSSLSTTHQLKKLNSIHSISFGCLGSPFTRASRYFAVPSLLVPRHRSSRKRVMSYAGGN